MAIVIETVVRVYCDGPSHNHMRLVFLGQPPRYVVDHAIDTAGWLRHADGRTYCAEHHA